MAQAQGRMLPGPAGKFADMKSRGASIEAIQAVIGASLANRAHGEDYSRLHAPAWEMSTGFNSPSWLAALECLDVEEFDEDNEMFEHSVHRTLSKAATHKVPRLLLLVVSLKLRPSGEATAVLKDPTGQVKAAVHRAVLEAEPNFGPGATVSLKDVSLLCPWPGMEYLCVTQRNILQVFPARAPPPPFSAPRQIPSQGQPVFHRDSSPERHGTQHQHQQVLLDAAPPLSARVRPDPIILAPPQPVHSRGGSISNEGTARVMVPATLHSSGGQSLQGPGQVHKATGTHNASNYRAAEVLQQVQRQQIHQQRQQSIVAEQNLGANNQHEGVGAMEEEQEEAAAPGDEEAEEEEEQEQEEEEDRILSLPQFNVLGVVPPPGATHSQKHVQQRQGGHSQPPWVPQQPLNPLQQPQQPQHPLAKRQRINADGVSTSAGAPVRQSSVGAMGSQPQRHIQATSHPIPAAATAPSAPAAAAAAAAAAVSAAMPPPAPRKPLFELTGQQARVQQQQQQQHRQQQQGKQSVPAPGHLHGVPGVGHLPAAGVVQGRGFASQLQQQKAQQMRLSQLSAQMMPDDDEDIEL